ncbi:AMP-binding protein [Streptomyces sp. Iso 434]|uniref:AMP-binding protein n=1 Tax=Streptomyces sp. Iso 434 TaxID=3062272 RepID=UPI00398170F0
MATLKTLSDPSSSVVTLFEAAALRDPAARAVEGAGGETLTYGQLRSRMHLIASGLLLHGLAPGGVVAVRGRSSTDLVATALGVLWAGGVLLLVDENLPAARRALLLDRARPAIRLTTGVPEPGTGELTVTALEQATPEAATPVASGREPERTEAAYIFFTSGSTGTPKGILGSHRGLAHFITWEIDALRAGPGDRIGQLTSLSFDVVLRDLFLPLCSGATLILPDEPGRLNGRTVLPWLRNAGITVLHTVPSLVRSWLRTPMDPGTSSFLRATCFAGEPLTGELASHWQERTGGGDIWNLYGPTETTLAKFAYRLRGDEEPGVLPVGSPLPQCEVWLLDRAGSPVGGEIPGEVVLRTPHRSLGYLDGHGKPTGGFRQNPDGEPGDWLYHTGDLATRLPDGRYVVRGRMDDQVKIQGVRIEPSEVAAAVRTAARPLGGGDAFALAVEDAGGSKASGTPGASGAPGGKTLIAFVEGALGGDAVERIVDELRRSLPLPMVPALLHPVGKLPLTSNGKVDRASLRHQALALLTECGRTRAVEEPHDEDSDPLLSTVRWAMATALDVGRVQPGDNFFSLGGDSLAAAELSAILEEKEGIAPLGHMALLSAPTPRALADALRGGGMGRDRQPGDAPELPEVPQIERLYPLSPQQRRFAAFYLADATRSWANVQLRLALPAEVDTELVRTVLRLLVARHPSLRTRFIHDGEEVRQTVAAAADVSLDLAEHHADPASVARELIAVPVPLTGSLPYVTHLVRHPAGDELVLVLNHMVTDGTSQEILRSDFAYITGHLCDGAPLPAVPPAPAYAEYARHRSTAEPTESERLWNFWQDELAAVRPMCLPRDGIAAPRPGQDTELTKGAFTALRLDAGPERLAALAARHQSTSFSVLLGLFTQALTVRLERDEAVLLVPTTGREPATATVVGNFHNILPVRVRRADDLAGTVRSAQAALARSLDHQWMQLDHLVKRLGMHPADDPYPLSSVLFNAIPGASPLLPANAAEAAGPLPYDVRYDLMGVVRTESHSLVLELHYRSALMTPDSAGQLLQTFAAQLTPQS